MEPELDPLQAPCNNVYTVLKLTCHCVNQNDNTTIISSFYCEIKNNSERAMHGFIQVLVQAHKSILTSLVCLYQDKYCCQEHEGTPSGLFGNQQYKNYALLQTFYTNAHVFVPFMMSHDAKLQLVKNSCRGSTKHIKHAKRY